MTLIINKTDLRTAPLVNPRERILGFGAEPRVSRLVGRFSLRSGEPRMIRGSSETDH